MYCPHCSQFIVDIGDFDDGDYTSSFESDSWSYDESEMSVEEYMPYAEPRSTLKRPRPTDSFTDDLNTRPLKRVRTESDAMDVDDDINKLTKSFANLKLN